MQQIFPLAPESNIRHTEKYSVNFARTENYRNSAIPYCQRLLNENCGGGEEGAGQAPEEGGGQGQEGGELDFYFYTTVNDNL